MACCLLDTRPLSEPMLEYCKLDHRTKCSENSNQNITIFTQENGFENIVCKTAVISSRHQCVNDRKKWSIACLGSGRWWKKKKPTPSLTFHSGYILIKQSTKQKRVSYIYLNTMRPRHHGRHFAYDTFKSILLNENVRISINFSLKFVPRGAISNIPVLM